MPRKPFGGITIKVDELLAKLTGQAVNAAITPPQLVKGLWDYVKAHDLKTKQ